MKNVERYSRQILLDEFGVQGQKRLKKASVIVIGAGGLGSPIIMYLAASGIGRLGIMDGDVVDVSNLHRQIAHRTIDVGTSKAHSAASAAAAINDSVKIDVHNEWLTFDNIVDVIKDYDVVVDAVDSFQIKYMINDACVISKKPFSHGGVVRWSGQVFTHVVGGPCLRCIIPDPTPKDVAPTCSRSGVLGPTVGVIASIQAVETIKLITGLHTLSDQLLTVETLTQRYKRSNVIRNFSCSVCGDDPTITEVLPPETVACDITGNKR